ncbi:DHFS-FPGS-like protein C [Perilla frutescens var. hirtella]|nr:DHFS-FPGS-like protein C [Perilla frutescens var. hirtella]KAH6817705.1 DHFS-FPGS-like protein C [Perilla frutescens var. frutescens]
MLKYKNLFLRPGLIGKLGFHQRERLIPSKLTWAASCLPACLAALDLVGTKRLHFQEKGFRVGEVSSQVLQPMESNTMIAENADHLHFPTTYEYDTAMEALSSLITTKRRGDGPAVTSKYTKLERMEMYIKILGLKEPIGGLKIIHVAGTKGKGSTCTFCEAILRECGLRTGLFTSPHLIDVRERFRLDGLDISEEKFLHYFWECWNQLKENVTDDLPMPPLFQFLTVLAFKFFVCEKVDVAIIEVGLGGTRDSTNVIKNPVVCGVSPLGMDHMETLGGTLEQIASHKAGIFKPHIPAFTVPQLSEAMDVLQEKARDLKVPLKVVAPLDRRNLKGTELSLSGDHQLTNAGLAVALCKGWLQSTGNWEKLFQHSDQEDNLPDAFLRGLQTARLSGRAEIVYDSVLEPSERAGEIGNSSGDLIFYLDGAHSPESMEACAKWFSSAVKEVPNQSSVQSFSSNLQTSKEVWGNGNVQPGKAESEKTSKKILLFNCMDVRDPQILLPILADTCALSGAPFEKAIFVPGISTYTKVTSGSSAVPSDIPPKDLSWQFNLQRAWEKVTHGKDAVYKTLEGQIPDSVPPRRFLDEDVTNCSPADGQFACSAVVSSLPMTINWLRDYVKKNPSSRIQILVLFGLFHYMYWEFREFTGSCNGVVASGRRCVEATAEMILSKIKDSDNAYSVYGIRIQEM